VGRIDSERQVRLGDGFGPGQEGHQEHLQLLDRRVLQRFLVHLELAFQRGKKVGSAQIAAQDA
jgi:hypothetical protein